MVKPADLTGKQFGRWTVQKRIASKRGRCMWRCVCQCGRIKDVPAKVLLNGNSKSCGCWRTDSNNSARFIDLKGKTFGAWTVLAVSPARRRPREKIRWICVCLCGETREVYGCNLRRGVSQSCGACNKRPKRHLS